MEFYETIGKRHSVRKFAKKEIEKEKIVKILEAIRTAPSAGNLQAYDIYLVREESKRQELMLASMEQESVSQAPISLVFIAKQEVSASKYKERGAQLYAIQDATIAAAYSQLAATAEGLSSVWIGAFDSLEVSRIVNAGAYEMPVAIIPIGYSAEQPDPTERRSLEDLVHEV